MTWSFAVLWVDVLRNLEYFAKVSSFNFWDNYLNIKEENRAFSEADFGEHFSLSSLSH